VTRSAGRSASASGVVFVDLDEHGEILDPDTGIPLPAAAVAGYLDRRLCIPDDATDIVVFVHGWRNTPSRAAEAAVRLASLLDTRFRDGAAGYPAIRAWNCYYVIVRWPSMTGPSPSGYRRIRDSAHAMSTEGRAAEVIAGLLGYLNSHREKPGAPPTLRNRTGQYLHCVGHSFGGRFLVQALIEAGAARPAVLGWDRADPRYPYAVDTLLIFQMAARADVFADRLAAILSDSPINGPIVLTHSRADRATGLWHRFAENAPGVGHAGAREPSDQITSLTLRPLSTPYQRRELDFRIVNIDASRRFKRGRAWRPEGAHSDFWYPESAHLLLSLADLAR
jgi:hypothetical protein